MTRLGNRGREGLRGSNSWLEVRFDEAAEQFARARKS